MINLERLSIFVLFVKCCHLKLSQARSHMMFVIHVQMASYLKPTSDECLNCGGLTVVYSY